MPYDGSRMHAGRRSNARTSVITSYVITQLPEEDGLPLSVTFGKMGSLLPSVERLHSGFAVRMIDTFGLVRPVIGFNACTFLQL